MAESPAEPLLLLPLRLEYRYVGEGKERFATVDHAALDALRRDPTLRQRSGQRGPKSELVLTGGDSRKTGAEILFRWFPDDAFALEAVPPKTEEEGAALEVFSEAIDDAGAPWHDTKSSAVLEAWATLGETVDIHRALALLRRGSDPVDDRPVGDRPADDWQDAAGKIVGLPRRVVLYTVTGSEKPQLLAEGAKITEPVRYTPNALHADSWLMSFDDAVDRGMGLRLRAGKLVDQALKADWVFAVGVGRDEATTEIADLFDNARAHGRFEVLPQDVPTNNTDGAPSGYSAKVTDLAATLRAATYDQRADDKRGDTDADRLAAALGLDREQVYRSTGAARRGVSHAETMATVLLPALLEGKFDRSGNDGTRRVALYRFLRRYAFARGPLPAIRLGHSPFGVLPVAPLDQLEASPEAPQADRRAFDFVKQVSAATLQDQGERVDSVPVLEPGAADAAQRLEEILQLNPVSKRVDVLELRELDRKFIGCPYVQSQEHDPAQYLVKLATRPLATLPDPSSKELKWPLLYRLIRCSRELLETSEAWAGGKGKPAEELPLRAALLELSKRSPEELEILMMEVLDLLRHRADAWATALATCRLDRQRRAGTAGLGVGYYGVLSKLRRGSSSSATDGYVQAPGIPQAITAGLLRSASLRFAAEGAFDIDLSSRRARRATKVLEGLRQGSTLREVLGLRTERWLHDRGADLLIHELRRIYPLAAGGRAAVRSRLVDGLAFAEGKASDLGALDAGLRSTAADARAAAQNDLDALSDLVMSEAVHQLAKGNAGAANAWVQVLSGEPPPSTLQFLRTHRAGQGSTHRVALLLEAEERRHAKHPRAAVEPRLADLAIAVLEDFTSCQVGVKLADTDSVGVRLDLSLAADLGMHPVDLLIGGQSEVLVRARFHVLRLWYRDERLFGHLGPLPEGDPMAFLQALPMTLDTGRVDSGPALETLLAQGAWLRALVTKARPLEPSDLNAARPAAEALGDGGARRLLVGSIDRLRGRSRILRDALRSVRKDLTDRVALLTSEVKLALTDPPADDGLSAVEGARSKLDGVLVEASRFGLPEALRTYATGELLADPESLQARWSQIDRKLGEKIGALRSVLGETLDTGSRSALAAALERSVAALRSAVDGEAMPLWPPFEHTAETEPLLDETDLPVDEAVGEWWRIRPRLRAVAQIGQELPALRVFRVAAKAIAPLDDDPADPDPNGRDEAERPRSYYYGTFLAEPATWEGDVYGGVVFDEWSEQRPSTLQPTALAVNVDAPQSEPPHTLLLGVAGERQTGPWTTRRAVNLVQETLRLMQTRALPSSGLTMEGSGTHFFNLIEGKGKGGTDPRIPVRSAAFDRRTDRLVDLVEVDDIPDIARTARGLKER